MSRIFSDCGRPCSNDRCGFHAGFDEMNVCAVTSWHVDVDRHGVAGHRATTQQTSDNLLLGPEPTYIQAVIPAVCDRKQQETKMWADAQRDGRPVEYRLRRLRKFRNPIPSTTPRSLADGRCSTGWPEKIWHRYFVRLNCTKY